MVSITYHTNNRETDDFQTVLVQSFDDNYHRKESEPTSELERAVRGLRRKYQRVTDYLEAKSIYKEYMKYLYDLYGGKYMFRTMLRDGVIRDIYIPQKPGLKPTRFNNFIRKNKIALSKVRRDMFDFDGAGKLSEEYDRIGVIHSGEGALLTMVPDAKVSRLLEVSNRLHERKLQTGTMNIDATKLAPQEVAAGFSYLTEWFERKKRALNAEMSQKSRTDVFGISISDYTKSDWIDRVGFSYHEASDPYTIIGTRLVETQVATTMALYRQFETYGINARRMLSRNDKTGVSDIIKRRDKEAKKEKKKQKKIDQALTDAVGVFAGEDAGIDYDFQEYKTDMEDFSFGNIFRNL